MSHKFLSLGLAFLLAILVAACGPYRMPEDDDLHTIPLTNNPDVTNDPGMMTIPGADY